MHISTIHELCYLLTIDTGINVTYVTGLKKDNNDEINDVGTLIFGSKLSEVYWFLSDEVKDDEIVMGEMFRSLIRFIGDHIREYYL